MILQRELDFALALARDAGAIALDYQAQGRETLETLKIRDKGAGQGLVTRADTELNLRLITALAEAFPEDAIVAEESGETASGRRRSAERCWLIDPIDGTSEYSRLESSWAIHIGLTIAGEAALGVVFEPARRRQSWGICAGDRREAWGRRGDEAPHRLLRRPLGALDGLRLVSSKSHASPRTREVMGALAIDDARNLRLGSTGVKMMTVAWADADLYVHPRTGTKLWDSAAPHAILRGAGAEVSDLLGQPLRYRDRSLGNNRGLLACGAAEHPEIVRRLGDLARSWFLPGSR